MLLRPSSGLLIVSIDFALSSIWRPTSPKLFFSSSSCWENCASALGSLGLGLRAGRRRREQRRTGASSAQARSDAGAMDRGGSRPLMAKPPWNKDYFACTLLVNLGGSAARRSSCARRRCAGAADPRTSRARRRHRCKAGGDLRDLASCAPLLLAGCASEQAVSGAPASATRYGAPPEPMGGRWQLAAPGVEPVRHELQRRRRAKAKARSRRKAAARGISTPAANGPSSRARS